MKGQYENSTKQHAQQLENLNIKHQQAMDELQSRLENSNINSKQLVELEESNQ
jgi:hypothetical protein